MPVIDCHAQIGTGETWREPRRRVEYRVEHFLERAREAGIEQTCLMAPRSATYEALNRDVARVCEKYPGRFIGFAVHSPQREAGRIGAALRDEIRSLGLKGLKVDGHPTRELMDVVAELGIPVIYYPDDGGTAGPAAGYHMVATYYSSVNFILPHLGSYRSHRWWAHIEAIDLCKRYSNVYLEMSGVGYHKYREMATRELPSTRILFGSYAPELDPRIELYAMKLPKLPLQQQADVLGNNMLRLLRGVRGG